jgi:hypothetical protein
VRGRGFKVDEKWHERFAMITRGFVEEFSLRMSRNAWVLYIALGTFYNRNQQRAFPNLKMLFAVLPLSRYARCRALRELVDLGLVEVWGARRGRKRQTFYRLPYVDATGHHMSQVQQPTCEQLLAAYAEDCLPPEYDWVRQAYLKSRKGVVAWQ